MILGIYSIKDTLSGEHGDLVLFHNDSCAARWFDEKTKTSPFSKDLQLFKIGEYHTAQGLITEGYEFIKNAVEVVDNA